MLRKQFRNAPAATAFIYILMMLTGCSQSSHPAAFDSALTQLPAIIPEYTSDWPENEYTELIPRPEYGTMDYVFDDSENGRYILVLTDIRKEESCNYLNELKEHGYSEIKSGSNLVSAGAMLQKDSVILSVAYSENLLNILIILENIP